MPKYLTPEEREARHRLWKFERTCANPKRHKHNKLPIRRKPVQRCYLRIENPKNLTELSHNMAFHFQQLGFSVEKAAKSLEDFGKIMAKAKKREQFKKRRRRLRAVAKKRLAIR